MELDLLVASVAALAQGGAAWLGWHVTVHPAATPQRRRLYSAFFGAVALLGTVAILAAAYRSAQAQARVERLELKNVVMLQRMDENLRQLAQSVPRNAVVPITPPQPSGGPVPSADAAAAEPMTATMPADALQPHSYPTFSVPETEFARREAMLNQLRSLWIASNDNISPAMMAGLEWPPEAWLNEQLAKYQQDWRVSVSGPSWRGMDARLYRPNSAGVP